MKAATGVGVRVQVVGGAFRGNHRLTLWPWILGGALVPLFALMSTGCASAGGGGGGGGSTAPDTGGDDDNVPPGVDSAAREIEEADIVKLEGGFFYLANRYRGLRIIDATNIEQPRLAGGLDMTGRGVELFVDDDRAFVVTSADFFSCGGEPVSFEDSQLAQALLVPDYSGSRITVADVSDPEAPFEISHFDMDGFITATRRVGDIIYAAGNFDGPGSGLPGEDGADDVSTDGPDGELPPPSSTGDAVEVDESGQALASATSPAGTLGEFRVAGAQAGGFVQVSVADGNTRGDLSGVIDGADLPLTVSVTGDLLDGSFAATLVIEADSALLDTFGTSLDNLAIYHYDEALGVWIAKTSNLVGASDPGGDLGDTGFFVADAGAVSGIWAVVDSLGDYVVGRRLMSPIVVSVEQTDGGTVVLNPARDTYEYLDEVTANADADPGFRFAGWGELPPAATVGPDDTVELLLLD
ncbi:MAG: beta-propeller domain-containing protein, partial [Phycisphaerae bacterium]